jgi:hypothetical protein
VVKPQATSAGDVVPLGCEVSIELIPEPRDGTEFKFVQSQGDEFALQDPGRDTINLFVPNGGTLMVTEIVPENWALANVDCESEGAVIFTIIQNGLSVDNCNGAVFSDQNIPCSWHHFFNTASCTEILSHEFSVCLKAAIDIVFCV